MSGANSIEEAIKIRIEVSSILKEGQFVLRKWCSNHENKLKDIEE